MGVIYKITNPSNKIYIGKTYDLRKRINAHKCTVKYGKNIILHNSIRKYGWDNHILEVLEEVEDALMDEREIFWISELKSYCYENPNGLNMTKGGDGQRSTWMHKTELRKFFSQKFSGEGNPFYGKKHSEETRGKLSEIAKIRNKLSGRRIPEWGAEKGREIVMVKILQYTINNQFVKEFESVTEAAKENNVTASMVTAVCRNRRKSTGGFVFKYKESKSKDLYEEILKIAS